MDVNIEWSKDLRGRSLLRLEDLSDREMLEIVDLAMALKARRAAGVRGDLLSRRHLALIFEKSSTRTRSAAVVAMRDEGGSAEYLTRQDIHLGAKESIADTARVLGRMFDAILFRGFDQATVEGLKNFSGRPVWNGLTDTDHPTQVLADLMTIREAFGTLKGLRLVYLGDARNNVANSLMMGCAKAGLHFVACAPKSLWPEDARVVRARETALANGGSVHFDADPGSAVRDANVFYTDVWVSMGEEASREERLALLRPYQVNMELIEAAGTPEKNRIFLHCLPAFHDRQTDYTRETGAMEVTDEVFGAPFSRVFEEAENRMHTMKALFVSSLSEGGERCAAESRTQGSGC